MYNGSKLEKIYKKAWVVLNHSSYNLKVIKQYMKAAQYMGQKWRERKKEGKTKPVKKDQSASFCQAGAIFAHHMTKSSVQIIENFL